MSILKIFFLPLSSLSDENSFVHRYSLSRFLSLIKNRWINEIHRQINSNSRIPRDWTFYFDEMMLCDGQIVDNRSWFQRFGFYLINLLTNNVQWIRTDKVFKTVSTMDKSSVNWSEEFYNQYQKST
ncbi:unnamed protein product [Adineta ricciae]|uniref:Uncharacterized protein n=1 Tax=Adineta ricciae TaxID=249248 RepID=A0A815V9R8_ADIRI|nr:unnamed protein product [Adineta ricciae]